MTDHKRKHLINSFAPLVHLETGHKVSGPNMCTGLIQFGVFVVGRGRSGENGWSESPPPRLPFSLSQFLTSQEQYRFVTEICGTDPITHLGALFVQVALLSSLFS